MDEGESGRDGRSKKQLALQCVGYMMLNTGCLITKDEVVVSDHIRGYLKERITNFFGNSKFTLLPSGASCSLHALFLLEMKTVIGKGNAMEITRYTFFLLRFTPMLMLIFNPSGG